MTIQIVEIVGIFLAIIFAITMYYHGYMILHERVVINKMITIVILQECEKN